MKSRGRPHGGFSTEASGVGLRLQPALAAGVKGQLLQSGTSRVSGAGQRWPWRVYTSSEVARLTHLVCRAQ